MAEGQAQSTPVLVLMGSASDWSIMSEGTKILEEFGVGYKAVVASAHRSPKFVEQLCSLAKKKGFKVIVCGAGFAAHLAGAVAAQTTLPVIGVPLDSSPLLGLDALLATVQMPAGVPVATVAIGSTGAKNAAYLAMQILALGDERLENALVRHREEMEESILTTKLEKDKKKDSLAGDEFDMDF